MGKSEPGWAQKEINQTTKEQQIEAERIAFKEMYGAVMERSGEDHEKGTTLFGGSTDEATMPDGRPYYAQLQIPTFLWKVVGEPLEIEVYFRVRKAEDAGS